MPKGKHGHLGPTLLQIVRRYPKPVPVCKLLGVVSVFAKRFIYRDAAKGLILSQPRVSLSTPSHVHHTQGIGECSKFLLLSESGFVTRELSSWRLEVCRAGASEPGKTALLQGGRRAGSGGLC